MADRELFTGNNGYKIHCQDLTTEGNVYLPTSGGTPSSLNYYEEAPFSYAVGGALVSLNLTGTFARINGLVVMNFTALSGSSAGAYTLFMAAASVPVRFRPSVDVYAGCYIMSNSAVTIGTVKIQSDGAIVFYSGASSNFSASGNAGVYKCSITYAM